MSHRTRGRYYEELEVGEIYEHRPGRTITEFDNTLFTLLSCNLQPLHIDAHYSKDSEFGQRLGNSILTLAIVNGLQVHDLSLGTTVANLGFDEIEFPSPVFIGDTIYSETEILSKRRSDSRDDSGIVVFEHRGRNQDGELVCKTTRSALMLFQPEGES